MDGMIFAAGLGTRLRPLTDRTPKALIEVGDITLLERTIERLAGAGCDRIVINVHHHAERIIEFLRAGGATSGLPGAGEGAKAGASGSMPKWYGAEIVVSVETGVPLETGGGLKQAAGLFRCDRTILVHNVDVISSVDLRRVARMHEESAALATLAVNRRSATRYLVFDERGLCGRVDTRTGTEEWARSPSEHQWRAGFTGVQALSPVMSVLDHGAVSAAGGDRGTHSAPRCDGRHLVRRRNPRASRSRPGVTCRSLKDPGWPYVLLHGPAGSRDRLSLFSTRGRTFDQGTHQEGYIQIVFRDRVQVPIPDDRGRIEVHGEGEKDLSEVASLRVEHVE